MPIMSWTHCSALAMSGRGLPCAWAGFIALGGYSFCDAPSPQGKDATNAGDGGVLIERLATRRLSSTVARRFPTVGN